jgi:NAD+ diphosphatase
MQSKAATGLDHDDNQPGLWFVFHGDNMLVKTKGEAVTVPHAVHPTEFDLKPFWEMDVGPFGEIPCYSALMDGDMEAPDGMEFQGFRGLFGQLEDNIFGYAGRALQLVRWDITHQYCSRCGKPAGTRNEDGAQICHHCGFMTYPRISPAVIVAVLRDDKILLAHNNRFPKKRYSVIAGYVEMGESLETCVRREIREEVGIEVKNIRYFGSQPWWFTSSLMVGFTAEYASGQIRVDNAEIAHASWFSADDLPDIPDKVSIARQLIDSFVDTHKNK